MVDGRVVTSTWTRGPSVCNPLVKDFIVAFSKDGWAYIDPLDDAEPQKPVPVPFLESQLHELCIALGWQGGTYYQVLEEIKRLKTIERQMNDPRQGDHC